MNGIVGRLRRKAQAALHDRACRAILATPPIVPGEGPILFSMIGSAVLLPYLVAVKSLHARLGQGRVALLDDGTLTAADRALLARQLGDPQILDIRRVETGACPSGGCWERLLTLVDLARDAYVIQLDSDTVTLGAVPEVAEAVREGRSFTLAGGPEASEAGILPLTEFVPRFYPAGPAAGHVQSQLESRFTEYPDAASHCYVRGSAGFAGFAQGSIGRAEIERFSQAAAAIVGADRWRAWGSEQIASNFLVSNQPGAQVLPYARYMNYWDAPWDEDTRFVHFVGTHRFSRGAYTRASLQAIAALRSA